jgi:Protein of unknown function (DUF4246)
MRTRLERRLDDLTCTIRAKPEWWRKVHDSSIVERWRGEFISQCRKTRWGGDYAADLFNLGIQVLPMCLNDSRAEFEHRAQNVSQAYRMQQLRHWSTLCKEDGIRPSPVNDVFESDAILGPALRQEILAALKPLEDVPEDKKDWHPGEQQQVSSH